VSSRGALLAATESYRRSDDHSGKDGGRDNAEAGQGEQYVEESVQWGVFLVTE
jgi:hypothetical protein